MNIRDRVIAEYRRRFQAEPDFIARAPGRVNLLGEHVDYNAGFVLPAAIDRATWVAFAAAGTSLSTIVAADFAEEIRVTPETIALHQNADGSPLPEWGSYPAGTAWALAAAGLATPGLQAVFTSDVPRGSGLSSSASVEMAFGVAWQTLGGWTVPPMQLARHGQTAENRYVGVNCGIMDQFASACGVAEQLLWLDCRSLQWQTLPIPASVAIIIADTTVRRKLTSGGYNERRQDCETAVQTLARHLPGIQALRDVSVDDFNRLAGELPDRVARRARHVVEEVDRTRRAIPLLRQGQIREFGQMVNACHVSLRDLFEVSIPELDAMVEIAQPLPGCLGARLTGAGFGGCTVNLVEKPAADEFAQALARGYEARTGLRPEIYICRAADGARAMAIR